MRKKGQKVVKGLSSICAMSAISGKVLLLENQYCKNAILKSQIGLSQTVIEYSYHLNVYEDISHWEIVIKFKQAHHLF